MTVRGGALVFVAKPSGRIFLRGSELAANRGFYLRPLTQPQFLKINNKHPKDNSKGCFFIMLSF